jgi:hypothetical protein
MQRLQATLTFQSSSCRLTRARVRCREGESYVVMAARKKPMWVLAAKISQPITLAFGRDFRTSFFRDGNIIDLHILQEPARLYKLCVGTHNTSI